MRVRRAEPQVESIMVAPVQRDPLVRAVEDKAPDVPDEDGDMMDAGGASSGGLAAPEPAPAPPPPPGQDAPDPAAQDRGEGIARGAADGALLALSGEAVVARARGIPVFPDKPIRDQHRLTR